MIVNNFNFKRIAGLPTKTNPKLIINPNAVLTGAIPVQCFQMVPWWHAEVV